jgi:methionine synthase I (cobalamin-dependent)
MNKWNSLATEEAIKKTVDALFLNGIEAIVVETIKEVNTKRLMILFVKEVLGY